MEGSCDDLQVAGWRRPTTTNPAKTRWAAVRDGLGMEEVPGHVDRIQEVLVLVVVLRWQDRRGGQLLLFADFAVIGSDWLGIHRKQSLSAARKKYDPHARTQSVTVRKTDATYLE